MKLKRIGSSKMKITLDPNKRTFLIEESLLRPTDCRTYSIGVNCFGEYDCQTGWYYQPGRSKIAF